MPYPWMAYAAFWFMAVYGWASMFTSALEIWRRRRYQRRLVNEPIDVLQRGYRCFSLLEIHAEAWRGSSIESHAERVLGLDPEEARDMVALAVLFVDRKKIRRLTETYRRALIANVSGGES